MKVKAISKISYGTPDGAVQNVEPGMIVDVPEDIAKKWVEMGWAEEVE